MKTKEKQYRVLHHLLDNPIFLERIAYLYETLLDSQNKIEYRKKHLRNIKDELRVPPVGVMRRICEAYRIEKSRIDAVPDTRDNVDIESELLSPYIPPIS